MFDRYRPQLDPTTHTYIVPDLPDVRLKSVTQVVDSFSRPFDTEREAARYAHTHNLLPEFVFAMWEEKRINAEAIGDCAHTEAEQLARSFNTGATIQPANGSGSWPSRTGGYIEGVYKFYREHLEARLAGPIAELRVAFPEFRLAGTIDLITNLDGQTAILDWKTSESMDFLGFGGKNMYAPFHHLPDSNFFHYALQLNIYHFIMRKVHAYDAKRLGIIWLRSDGTYEILNVLPMDDQLLIKGLRRHVNRLKKEEKDGKSNSCSN